MNPYKIFYSDLGDWYVVGKMNENKDIDVIFEGHSRSQAFEAILRDQNLLPTIKMKYMSDIGTYFPVPSDWE